MSLSFIRPRGFTSHPIDEMEAPDIDPSRAEGVLRRAFHSTRHDSMAAILSGTGAG